jgi:hypothetical protein
MSAGTFRRRCGFETRRPLKGCFQQSQPSGWLFYWRDRLPVRYATWRSWASPRSTSAVTEGNCGKEKTPSQGGLGEVTRNLATEDFGTGKQARVYSLRGPLSCSRLTSRRTGSILNY